MPGPPPAAVVVVDHDVEAHARGRARCRARQTQAWSREVVPAGRSNFISTAPGPTPTRVADVEAAVVVDDAARCSWWSWPSTSRLREATTLTRLVGVDAERGLLVDFLGTAAPRASTASEPTANRRTVHASWLSSVAMMEQESCHDVTCAWSTHHTCCHAGRAGGLCRRAGRPLICSPPVGDSAVKGKDAAPAAGRSLSIKMRETDLQLLEGDITELDGGRHRQRRQREAPARRRRRRRHRQEGRPLHPGGVQPHRRHRPWAPR